MQVESLDVLEKADVPPGQARAIVRAIEIEITGAKDVLATKHDIALLRAEMHGEISGIHGEISGVRGEMSEMRGDLRAEIHASASSVARQMYAALLAQMAVLLGIMYFFVTRMAS